MEEGRRAASFDSLLYGGSALVAAGLSVVEGIPLQRDWARVAVWAYTVGALAAAVAASLRRRVSWAFRATVAAAVIGGVALVPTLREIVARAQEPAHTRSPRPSSPRRPLRRSSEVRIPTSSTIETARWGPGPRPPGSTSRTSPA
jgi:hypothetical protein